MYEYAIAAGHFLPRKPEHTTSEFIGRFSGGGLDHIITKMGFMVNAR